jgi:integrase
VRDNLAEENPFAQVTMPKITKDRIVPLTVAQVRDVASAVPERFRAAVYAQAGLGLRVGELLALREQDVVFLLREVHVVHQVAPRTLELIPPKTERSKRMVPLPDVVGTMLSAQIAMTKPGPGGLLWYTSTGRPINHDHYRIRFTAAVRKAKLPEGTTPHDLRHHYASVLLAARESVIAVAERLGHDNANLVLSTYGHLMPDQEDRTRKAIDGAWSTLSAETPATQARPK